MILIKKFGEGICYLELNRPAKRNALNKKMIEELISFLELLGESTQFKVLVMSGSEGFFSAGADLEWMKQGIDQTYKENLEDARLFSRLFTTLWNFPKPIVLKVEKGAFGGALGLLACADVVVTSPDAVFSLSEVSLGLVPATVAPFVMQKTGFSIARHLMLTADTFSGEDALRYNLVHLLAPAEKLGIKTREIALKISRNSPYALKETKNLLNSLEGSVVCMDKEIERLCTDLIAKARISPDGQEGVMAFFEKRKPNWNDII
jgi:methylglutaconyl-CoA hydratase